MANGPRTRVDVWSISVGEGVDASTAPWHDTLDAYERAVHELSGRPPADADSWEFLANTHGAPGSVPTPTGALWRQCAHASIFFLPWHRAYLRWFESAIQGAVDDDTWALPYWGYEDPDQPNGSRRLPPEFRVRMRTVGGTLRSNALYRDGRRRDLNAPAPGNLGRLETGATSIVEAMANVRYAEAAPATGFGGTYPPASVFGGLESLPHNDVHVQFRPPTTSGAALMLDPRTAAQDPIFWLHHSEVDRLWEMWLQTGWAVPLPDDPAAPAPVVAAWASAQFQFGYAADPEVFANADLVDTSAEPLHYVYDTITPPEALEAAIAQLQSSIPGGPPMAAPNQPPQPVEWRPQGEAPDVVVPADGTAVTVGSPAPPGASAVEPNGLLIELRGIRSPNPAPSYVVEVQVGPDGPIRPVGTFATFGVNEETETAPTATIDASAAIPALLGDSWRGDALRVTVRPDTPSADAGPDAAPVDDGPQDVLSIEAITMHTH